MGRKGKYRPPKKSEREASPIREILDGDDNAACAFVSRGGLKLQRALEAFALDATGLWCADLGCSTGGFTDCLLQADAARVYAVDTAYGELAWKVRTDERVVVMEGTNARHLDSLPEPIDFIVGDLSFIGLALILPTVWTLLRPGGQAVVLVKPQFEAGREHVDDRGRVSDPDARADAIERVTTCARDLGFTVLGGRDCDVPGARSGNVEYFLHIQRPPDVVGD